MGFIELLLVAVGLSMDAFAVAVCKGLSVQKLRWKHYLAVGLWFGGFQALMPMVGYLLGTTFERYITSVDHWVAFVLLCLIGGNMLKEGLSRDEETAKPIEYFCKLPCDISEREVIVVDPMLATGGSAIDAVSMIKKHGAANIKFMCIIAAPEGLAAFGKVHPDVKVYVGALDEKLNDRNYIVPGLGDAGDRIFGTK